MAGKVVELENLHITLIFLGEQLTENLGKIVTIGEELAILISPFDVTFKGAELMPTSAKGQIVNYALAKNTDLSDLQSKLDRKLKQAKIKNAKHHQPHLTLMRLNKGLTVPLPKLKSIKSKVTEFSLIESTLSEVGPAYKVLNSFQFQDNSEKYRPNVVICVVNKDNKVLIIKHAEFPGEHWQLPQGGTDGDSLRQAAVRELYEETAISSIKILKISMLKYKYKFPLVSPEYENSFIGQQQTPVFIRFTGDDDEIKMDPREISDFKWVRPDELVKSVVKARRDFTTKIYNELKTIL